jgi:hypothetical protein
MALIAELLPLTASYLTALEQPHLYTILAVRLFPWMIIIREVSILALGFLFSKIGWFTQ